MKNKAQVTYDGKGCHIKFQEFPFNTVVADKDNDVAFLEKQCSLIENLLNESNTYYKADLCISTVELDKEGCEVFQSYNDYGQVNTFVADSLLELIKKIESSYYGISTHGTVFENRIELQYEFEHDYLTPLEDQVPMIETATFYITKVTKHEQDVSEQALEKLIKKDKQ
jgi:hypothetical protein